MSNDWRSATNANFDNGGVNTSRAMNIALEQAEVVALCQKRNATISAIEPLPAGGTRLVLTNADDAAVMRKALKSKLIDREIRRTRWAGNG